MCPPISRPSGARPHYAQALREVNSSNHQNAQPVACHGPTGTVLQGMAWNSQLQKYAGMRPRGAAGLNPDNQPTPPSRPPKVFGHVFLQIEKLGKTSGATGTEEELFGANIV